MNIQSTVDAQEVAKFAQHANAWWDSNGPLKTLHDINPIRIDYIQQIINKSSLSSLKNQRVLDIGCGGGILSEGIARCGGIVTGLDVEPDAIATAKKHAAKNKLSIQYECQPIETFHAEPFPIITCLEMLEHVQEPEKIIEHAARLLAPGGYLFLSTINRTIKAYASVIIAAEYLLNILPRQTHDFQKFIKPSELARIARKAGLETIDLCGMNYNPFTRTAALNSVVTTNYLLVCRAPFF